MSVSGPFVCRCPSSLAMLRFHFPLIEPDVRFSRIRLSDEVIHAFAHGELQVRPRRWMSPSLRCTYRVS